MTTSLLPYEVIQAHHQVIRRQLCNSLQATVQNIWSVYHKRSILTLTWGLTPISSKETTPKLIHLKHQHTWTWAWSHKMTSEYSCPLVQFMYPSNLSPGLVKDTIPRLGSICIGHCTDPLIQNRNILSTGKPCVFALFADIYLLTPFTNIYVKISRTYCT